MDVSRDRIVSEPSATATTIRFVLGSIAFFIIFVVLSYLINMVVFAEAHAVVTFFRPEDDPLVSSFALSLHTLAWSFIISASYKIFGQAVPIRRVWLRGLSYGALVFLLFILQQEVFYYQFIDFPVGILWGALLHMGLAFPLGCMLVSVIQAGRWT